MAKMKAIAHLIEYDQNGKSTKKPVRVYATLCPGMNPHVFTIELPDKRATRGTCIQITRAEIERVLADN